MRFGATPSALNTREATLSCRYLCMDAWHYYVMHVVHQRCEPSYLRMQSCWTVNCKGMSGRKLTPATTNWNPSAYC